jgi:hypothetical protein
MQLSLFADYVPPPETIASPICIYDGACPRKGRCTVEPWARTAEGLSENRRVRCLTCKAHGEESRNLALRLK